MDKSTFTYLDRIKRLVVALGLAFAGMALVLAALSAPGRSVIRNISQIDRGYEEVDKKLASLGAQIQRVKD